MTKLARPRQRDQRRVFRRRRRLPVGMVIRHLLVILLLLSSGIGIVVLLQRLPEQVDLMVLVSQAISDLISGIQQLLSAMLGLGGVVLIAALVILAAVLMLAGLAQIAEDAAFSTPPSRAPLTRSQGALQVPKLLQRHMTILVPVKTIEMTFNPGKTGGLPAVEPAI